MNELRETRHTVDRMQSKLLAGDVDRFLFSAKQIGDMKVIAATRSDIGADELRKMGDLLKDKAPNVVAVLASTKDDKITLLAICGKGAVEKGIKAGELIKKVSAICGGSGGGKPDSAMGGGKDLVKLDDALATIDDFVSVKLGLK